jgi:Phosphatidylethanolamine-binding protein
VHWIVYNISPKVTGLAEGVPTVELLPDGTKQGRNDFNRIGYGSPCPVIALIATSSGYMRWTPKSSSRLERVVRSSREQ